MDKMLEMNQLFLATIDEDQNTTFIGGFFSEGEFSINDDTITAQDKELFYSPITDNCSTCESDFGDKLTIADSLTNITGDITPPSQTDVYKLFIIKERVYYTDGGIIAEPKRIKITSGNKITSSSVAEINKMIEDKKAEAERSAKQAEEELRIAAEAAAEEARKETERIEAERVAELAKAEAAKQAEETARLENEQKAKIAAAAAEAAALAAIKREQEAAALETARIEAEQKAKQAEAEKAEADRKAKEAEEQNLALEKQAEAKRLADEMAQRQALEAAEAAEAKRLADAAAEAQAKAEAEKKRADQEKEEAKRKLDETMQKNKENAERRQRAEEEKARRKEEEAAAKENDRNNGVKSSRGLLKTDEAKGILNSDKTSEPLSTMPKPDLDRIMTKIKNYDTIINKLEMPIITPAVGTSSNNARLGTRRNGGRKINNTKRQMRGGAEDTPKNRFITLCVAFNKLISKILTTPVFFKINSLTLNNLNALLDDDTVKVYQKNGTTVTEINKSIIFARIMNFIYFDCSDLETSDDGKKQIFTEIENQYGPFDNDLLLIENSNATNLCILFNNEPDLNKKFIHIKKFTSIMMYYVNNYDSVADQRLELEHIQNYFSSNIVQILENMQNIINTILIIEQSFNTNDFKQKIDDIIQMENSGKIITYVKITNLDNADKTYNKRFGVLTNARNVGNSEGRANMLMVKYNDDNFPYYKPENVKELDGRIKKLSKTDKRFEIVGESLTVNNYKSTYLFGKFNKIFNPSLSNEDISRQMNIVKSQALKGRPVFIMGYGASGAGKTSSLIYLNKGEESKRAGILIHLCNIFSAEGYNSLEITSKEFFTAKVDVGNEKCSGGNTEASPMNCITDKFIYSFSNGEFKLASNDVEYKNKHKYRYP